MVFPLLFASLLHVAAAQPGQPGEDEPIIVNAERVQDLRDRLRACITRNCPPNEDVDATLALAEAEFINGEYDDAEDDIAASIRRNRRHVRQYPEPVADLYRSQARVQSHRGRDSQALSSTYDILRSLSAGIPAEDHRHFTARLEIIRAEMRAGNLAGSRRELDELAEKARRAGRNDIVRVAEMRRLQLDYSLAPHGSALRKLRELAESTDPAKRFEAVSARFFLSRVYRDRGEIAKSDAMLAGVPQNSSGATRTLLHDPQIRLTQANTQQFGLIPSMNRENYEGRWVDIAYWIQPDGKVTGVEVLRQGSSIEWAQPVLAAIRQRVYSHSDDPMMSYRLERYTYTASAGVRTGSRLMARTGTARVEVMDLTTGDEPGRAPSTAVRPSGN
jgi:tetratricopeptide (TPR) repeat protein